MRGKESMPSSRKGRQNSPANDSYREADPDGKQTPPKRFRSGKTTDGQAFSLSQLPCDIPHRADWLPQCNTDLKASRDP